MNYEHWRHYARGWLFHFFGREESAFAAFSTAFLLNPQDVQRRVNSRQLPQSESTGRLPRSGSRRRWR